MFKLNSACVMIRSVKSMLSQETSKTLSFSYIRSLINMVQFFGAVHHPALKYSEKKIIGIITHSNSRDSCRGLFKKMKILPVRSQYINTIYVLSNQHLYTMNMVITLILDTIPIFIHPSPIWLNFRRGLFYSGIRIFNHLPADIKILMNDLERFHLALKGFLNSNSFYTLDKLFNCNR